MSNFINFFSVILLMAGLLVLATTWAGIRLKIAHPRNSRLMIMRSSSIAAIAAAVYSLFIFCPIFGWISNWSEGLTFLWFLIANPIWLFVVIQYQQTEYRIGINNLR